jgi:hypothetical protein
MKRFAAIALLLGMFSGEGICACATSTPVKASGTAATATTATVTLTIATATDPVVLSVWCVSTCTITGVQDGGARAYTKSINSPGVNNGGTGTPYIYYRLAAGTTGSTTITVTTSASIQHQVQAIEFPVGTSCTVTFDKDAFGTGSGTSVTTPSITPAGSGEILFGFVATAGTGITAAGSPWTLGNIAATTGNADEYDLSSPATATALAFTQASATYSGASAGFILTTSGGTACTPTITLMGAGPC